MMLNDSPSLSPLTQVKNGLPALLVYKGGEMKGNLLRVTDTLGEDYNVDDLETFLQE